MQARAGENAAPNPPQVRKLRAPPKPGAWLHQHRLLQEQEGQLAAACAAHAADAGVGREARAAAAGWQQLRVQLSKQLQPALAQLEGITAACAAPGSQPLAALEKLLRAFESSLTSLQSACAAQLEHLAQKEAAAAADLESTSLGLRAALDALPQQAGSGNGAPAATYTASTAAEPSVSGLSTTVSSSTASTSGRGSTPPSQRGQLQPSLHKPAPSAPELPAAVAECDAFLEAHGPTGGWHPDDHAEFERVLRACRGNYSHTVDICTEQLGLLHNREDIVRHARWHEELQDLLLRKRQAIQEWRLARAARQAELLQQAAGPEPALPVRSQQASVAEEQQREQQRLAVLEWKRAKEEQERRQQQAEQGEARQRQELERRARQARQQQLAGALAEFKQRKAQEYEQQAEGAAAAAAASSRPPTADPAAQRRLEERNQQLLARRQGLAARRTLEAQEREARLARLQEQASAEFTAIERDPGRVLQPTTAAQLRQLSAGAEERGGQGSGWIRHVQHKAVPSWCGSSGGG